MGSHRTTPWWPKVTLAVGSLALFGAAERAARSPAEGYELSLAAGTPPAFWAGISVALVASAAVAFGRRHHSLVRDAGLAIGTGALAAVLLLPVIRGYYAYGAGDALTHLGWTKDLADGALHPLDFLYPGVHTVTLFVAELTGFRIALAQQFVVLAFVLTFVLFTAACVQLLAGTELALVVGAFAGLLIIPNNNVSVHLVTHPITQTILFTPLILYLALRALGTADTGRLGLGVTTPFGAALSLAGVAVVLLHPQGAATIVVVLFAIVAGRRAITAVDPGWETPGTYRSVLGPAIVTLVAFLAWAPRHERVGGTVRGVLGGLVQGAASGDEIAQRSSSLAEVGGSVVTLFLKLFLVASLFAVLTLLLLVAVYGLGGSRSTSRVDPRLHDVAVTLVPLTGLFGLFFVASMTTQHFRYVGFLMVPVTILGAVALSNGARNLSRRRSARSVAAGLACCMLVLLALQLPTVHDGPYIYQPSDGVSEMHLDGTRETVAIMDRDVRFATIRGGPVRQLHAVYGTERAAALELGPVDQRSAIPPAVFASNLTTHYDEPRYVPVTPGAYEREVSLYDGLRYGKTGFRRLRTSPRVDRVLANGEYRLYLLGGRGA